MTIRLVLLIAHEGHCISVRMDTPILLLMLLMLLMLLLLVHLLWRHLRHAIVGLPWRLRAPVVVVVHGGGMDGAECPGGPASVLSRCSK